LHVVEARRFSLNVALPFISKRKRCQHLRTV